MKQIIITTRALTNKEVEEKQEELMNAMSDIIGGIDNHTLEVVDAKGNHEYLVHLNVETHNRVLNDQDIETITLLVQAYLGNHADSVCCPLWEETDDSMCANFDEERISKEEN